MDLGKDIRQELLNVQTIQDYVGTRIYPLNFPQGVTFPAIKYQLISNERPVSHTGSTKLQSPVFQISVFAESRDIAVELKERVINILNGLRGMLNNTKVAGLIYQSEQEIYEPETKLYHIPVEFKILS